MRITKPIRKQIYDAIVEKAYPLETIREMAKPIIDYLVSGKSEPFNEGVRMYEEHPDFVISSNLLRFTAKVDTKISYEYETVELPLPVRYAKKYLFDYDGTNGVTFYLSAMEIYSEEYRLNLPDNLWTVAIRILYAVRKKGLLRDALRSLDCYHTTAELIKAVPEAEDVIKEVLERSRT